MTRIESARRKVRIARYAIGITAGAGLAAFAAAARESHPAQAQAPANVATQQAAESSSDDDGFFSEDDEGASYSIGPSGGAAPQIQSGGS